jgi:hypothetical protein
MNYEYYLKYLELRKGGKIGRLWVDSGCYSLAPLDALAGLVYSQIEAISLERLLKMIDELLGIEHLKVERKPMLREMGWNNGLRRWGNR